MIRGLWMIVPMLAIGLCGCNAGDTPVQEWKKPEAGAPKDPMTQSVQNNPGIPDVAKKAMGGATPK